MDLLNILGIDLSSYSFIFLINLFSSMNVHFILVSFLGILQLYFYRVKLEYAIFKQVKPFIFKESSNLLYNKFELGINKLCTIIFSISIFNLLILLLVNSLNKVNVNYIIMCNILIIGFILLQIVIIGIIKYSDIVMTRVLKKSEELEDVMHEFL